MPGKRMSGTTGLLDPSADKVLISPATIQHARLTMLPLMEAQSKVTDDPDDEPDSDPLQANMLAHAGLLLHVCRELNIDVSEALIAASYMVGVMKTSRDTVH